MKNIIRLTETQLTNMVKRIVNESTASEALKDMVKTDGWKETSKLVDGPENLAKIVFNNDPLEYLNGLDLHKVRYTNDPNRVHFVDHKESNFLLSPLSQRTVSVNYDNIYEFLYKGFKIKDDKVKKLLKNWLNDKQGFHFDTVRGIR
jgi:hypothetical protein